MRMNVNNRKKMRLAILGAALCIWGPQAYAVAIVTDTSTTVSIPGLTTFSTSGDQMTGMTVQAVFSGGLTETRPWAATGAGSGGVTGTGWSMSQSGTTFNVNSWGFSNTTGQTLLDLVFEGAPGLTVFDIDSGTAGGSTPGSAEGRDFDTNLADDSFVTATYSLAVGIGATAAVGDIFHRLSVNFEVDAGDGVAGNFNFTQDTDNDSRLSQVPEPALPSHSWV